MKDKFINFLRIFTPLIIGVLIGILISNYTDYNLINKPFLSPPAIVFPIIWSILYLIIGYSYYLYRKNDNNLIINITYFVQLIFNFIWPILFFVFKLRLFSIFCFIFLIIFSLLFLLLFKILNKISFYLTIPYIVWFIFALYLNIGVYVLNN